MGKNSGLKDSGLSCKTFLEMTCEQLVPPTSNERETNAHRACTSSSPPRDTFAVSSICSLEVFSNAGQNNVNLSPKKPTKERFRPSSKYI